MYIYVLYIFIYMSHFWLNFLWPGTTVSGSPRKVDSWFRAQLVGDDLSVGLWKSCTALAPNAQRSLRSLCPGGLVW